MGVGDAKDYFFFLLGYEEGEEGEGATEMGEAEGSSAMRLEWDPPMVTTPARVFSVGSSTTKCEGGGDHCRLCSHCRHRSVSGGMKSDI